MGETGPDGLTVHQRAEKWRAIDEWLADTRLAVVPLYAAQGNRVPKHGGCAVVVRVGDDIALLTAGHVHDGFVEESGGQMAAATNTGFVPLTGAVVRSSRDQSGDPVDAAVMVLDRGDDADKLAESALTWHATDVTIAAEEATDLLLFGFPHRDAERADGRRVTPRRYFWEARVGTAADHSRHRVRSDERVVGHLPISRGVDDRGRITRSMRPTGVSGSGLWTVGSDSPRLLAIFTDAPGDEFIGTSVAVHALLLRRHFPSIFQTFISADY